MNREEPANPITQEDECEFNDRTEDITITELTLGEVKKAIKRLQNGNAPGIDNITAELLKADIELTKKVHQLLGKIWKHEKIPTNWKKGLIIKLAKKGNLKECKNTRHHPTLRSGKGTWKNHCRSHKKRNRLQAEKGASRLQNGQRNNRASLHTAKHN